MRTTAKKLLAGLIGLPVLTIATSCSSGGAGGGSGVIDYWLWDSNQQPGYQKCADAFEQENPDLKIKITQLGWGDYWGKLTAGFISDTAPDVFTNHLAKYAQFVDLDVLLPLDELEATKDVNGNDYQPGLADLWVGEDGHRYGTPKDWDTVALFYDKDTLAEADVSAEDLSDLEWNPTDGGSYEEMLAHLSVDVNGVRGDEPGFDKDHVQVYGMGIGDAGGSFGQTTWSAFAGSNDWSFADRNPWGTHMNYDQPNFQAAIGWYFGLAQKGFAPKLGTFADGTGPDKQLGAGRAALAMDGSWMISTYSGLEGIDLAFAPTPIGPSGRRASPFNGLADSVTKLADDPEAAAKWVKFLSGEECQQIIGEAGVVFPARPGGTEKSMEVRKSAGLDVTSFTTHITDETTFLLPVVNYAADIEAIMGPGMEAIYIGQEPVSYLADLNSQINTLFELG